MGFFKELKGCIQGIHEVNKEFVADVGVIGKEFKNDMKDLVKEHNPTAGKVLEGSDRFVQTIKNVLEELPNKPTTAVPDIKQYLRKEQWKSESELEIADHLKAARLGYSHHGLYLGDYQVIHYQNGEVRIDSLDDFKKGCQLSVINSITIYTDDAIINRAYSRLTEKRYNLIWNNCEHFVNWCRSGSNTTDSI